ncbi:MAG: cytidine deaminase [Lachnospiraceae bacterium]|nr:cytidine deaminase [Lachnospiraceae bacterium]
MNINDDVVKELVSKAIDAREHAYAPYSEFLVGCAALGSDGKIYTGCNIENVSYSATNCAERTAIFKGVSAGCLSFEAIAIMGARKEEKPGLCYPCGVCRQVLAEFSADEGLKIIIAKNIAEYKITTLDALMPFAFVEF